MASENRVRQRPLFSTAHYEHMMQALYDNDASGCTVQTLCTIFENDNPKFKRDLFVAGATTGFISRPAKEGHRQ